MAKKERERLARENDRIERTDEGWYRGGKERDWKVEDAEGEKEYVYYRIRTFFQKQNSRTFPGLRLIFPGLQI